MTDTSSTMSGAAARYELLKDEREHFVSRADKCAKLTLPMLFQRDAVAAKDMKIKDPAQSIGTRGVNAMSSKLVTTLFPKHTPFYKFNVDSIGNEELTPELKSDVEKGLGKLEKEGLKEIENSGDTTVFNEALKHLIVTGNVGLYVGDNNSHLYNLNKYVTLRDPDGNVVEAVLCEEIIPDSLPAEFLTKLKEARIERKVDTAMRTVKLYTWIKYKDGKVTWHQEVDGMTVPGSKSEVPEEGNPWLFLRFIRVDGENYGRSYIEMYLGDLESLEVLTKAVNDAAAAASKVIILVRPNGTTQAKVIAGSQNLAVVSGDANDVSVLQIDKQADMRIAKEMIEEITRRLAAAFMLRAEVMRDAERVTAEEVRIVARELDEANGGIYSILSQEFQLPYVKRRMFVLRKKAKIGKLPPGVSLAIVTGFAALGRADEGERLMRFIEKVGMLLQNPQVASYIKIDEAIKRLAIAEGVDLEDLVVTEEERAAEQQSQMGQGMLQSLGPELLKQAGPAIMQQMEGTPDGTSQATAG